MFVSIPTQKQNWFQYLISVGINVIQGSEGNNWISLQTLTTKHNDGKGCPLCSITIKVDSRKNASIFGCVYSFSMALLRDIFLLEEPGYLTIYRSHDYVDTPEDGHDISDFYSF